MEDITSLGGSKTHSKKSPFTIYHYDSQVAAAFQSDCENLLLSFKQRQTFSFISFAQLWKEMNFIAIFKGEDNILTIQAFLENCFLVIKKFLFSDDIHTQTGALYTLYGLYYKQPIKQWVKIRLVLSEVEKLNEIIEFHRASDSLEPVFIYSKMKLDGAFQYCALSQTMGLEPKLLQRYDLNSEDITAKNTKDSVLCKFKNLLEEDPDLVQLEETDDEYQKLSQKYKEKYGNLFVFPSKLGGDLKKAYSDTYHIDLGESPGGEDALKKKKDKAMRNTNAVYRGDRKVLTALDVASTSK